jgi:hypothetical protein
VTLRSCVQVLEITSCINAEKYFVHMTQSGQTLSGTLHKREVCAASCPLGLPLLVILLYMYICIAGVQMSFLFLILVSIAGS